MTAGDQASVGRERRRRAAGGSAGAGRQAPAHGQPAAQQDHRGRRPEGETAVFGSTNFSWRGFYVQSNNAVVVRGQRPIRVRARRSRTIGRRPAGDFGETASRSGRPRLDGIDAHVDFLAACHDQRAAEDDRDEIRAARSPRCCIRWRSCNRSSAPIQMRSRRSLAKRHLRLRHFRQEGRRARPAEAGRQRRAGHSRPHSAKNLPGAVQERADRAAPARACTTSSSSSTSTSRPPGCTSARTTSPRPADNERRKSASVGRPPHRRRLHDRSTLLTTTTSG